MMDKESLKKLAEEIMGKGFKEAIAWKYARLIGDTPCVDEAGQIVVFDDDGNELERLHLNFFSQQSAQSETGLQI